MLSTYSLHVLFSLEGMLGMSQQLVSWNSVAQPELYGPLLPQGLHGLQARHILSSCQLWRGYPLR